MGDWRQIAEEASRESSAGRIDDAIRLLDEAMPAAEAEGDPVALGSLLHNLGLYLDRAGAGVRAREVLERAVELLSSDSDGTQWVGETLRLLGMAEVEAGDGAAGLMHIEQAISHFQARSAAEGATSAQVDLGLALKDMGRLTEASANLSAALAAARDAGLTKVAAHALTGLGLVEEILERYDRAGAFHQDALDCYRLLNDEGGEATALYNLGTLADKAENYADAERWFGEALDLDIRSGNKLGTADCHAALASIGIVLGNRDQARRSLLKALRFYKVEGYRRRACDVLIDLAAIDREERRFAKGEKRLRDAEKLATELGDPRELHDVYLHWGDLRYVAGDQASARGRYAAAATAIQRARDLLVSEQDALSFFGADRVECIDRLIALTWQDDPRTCVEWVERAKAQELIHRLAGIQLTPPPDAPRQLRERWLAAAEQVRALSASLNGDEPASPEILTAHAQTQRRLDEAAAALDELNPEWAALRRGDALSWTEIQELLVRLAAEHPQRGIVLVHYYVREDSALAIGVRPGEDPELTVVPITSEELRTADQVPGGRTWAETERLLTLAVAPIASWTQPGDHVLVSAHDGLHRFALHAASIDGQLLGERNVVTYVSSAAVLRYCVSKRRGRPGKAVVLGDAEADRPLPFGHDQASAVADLLAEHDVAVDCLLGTAATSAAFVHGPLLPDAGLVHFAVHGSASSADGLLSGLRLADGPLTARQFLGLRLNSSLVFLGACDTGVSEHRAGDELIGLIRSAIYAGTASVIAALWPVDQLSSAMLVHVFYQRYLDGAAKPEALRAAQRWLRGATVDDALDYLEAARQRARGNASIETAVALARAQVLLFAYDVPATLQAIAEVKVQPDMATSEITAVDAIAARAQLIAMTAYPADRTRRPFDSPRHWAPFILIGDIS